MNFVENYPVCDKCQYEQLLYCKKYNTECVSINLLNNTYTIPCEQCLANDSYVIAKNKNQSLITKKAIFHIPDLSILDNIILLIEQQQKFPDAFYPNRIIGEIYDAFPGAIWNGRTPLFGKEFLSMQKIAEIKDKMEKYNLSLNLTWNNHLIKDMYLYDSYSNAITELFNNGQHSITVASIELLYYLKEHYPNYTFYQSHILTEKQYEININDLFDIYVISKKYNNNWEKLDSLSEVEKGKVEFLCNDNCFPGCNKNIHYETANQHLLLNCSETFNHTPKCLIDKNFKFYNTKHWPTTINPEDIDIYLDKGFQHFKLSGRGDDKEILLYKICKYFVKPEFFEDIYFSILGGNK